MGVVDKTVDTAGGTVVGGAKGAAAGFMTSVAIGAVLAAGIMLGGFALAGGAAAAFSGAGLMSAGAAALGGAVIGALPTFSIPMATIGGAIGGLFGGAKKLFGGKAEPEPQIDQMLAAERERSKALTAQLVERAQAASSFDNDVKGGMAPKVQAQQAAAQQQGATVG